MQISEELIKQITNAVLSQMSQDGTSSDTNPHPAAGSSADEIPSMVGRDRINEIKTSYADYPRAKKGTESKGSCHWCWCRFPKGNYKDYLWNSVG